MRLLLRYSRNHVKATLLLWLVFLFACAPAKPGIHESIVWPPPPHEAAFRFDRNLQFDKDLSAKSFWARAEEPRALFGRPFDISQYAGKIYITDINFPGYRVFDPVTRTILEHPVPAPLLPCGIDIDKDGNVYLSDLRSMQVLKVTANGTQWFEKHPALKKPTYLKIDDSGKRLFVSCPLTHQIHSFTLEGEYLESWGGPGDSNGQFVVPQGMATDSAGNLYVADMFNSRIQVLSPAGRYLRSIGGPGLDDAGLERPRALAISSDNRIFVVDYAKAKIITFDAEGNVLYSLGSNSKTSHPLGFTTPTAALIHENRLYVTDRLNRRLSIWELI